MVMGFGFQQNIGRANALRPNIALQVIGLGLIGLCLWGFYLSFSKTLFKLTSFIAALSVAYACLRFMASATAKPKPSEAADPDVWPFYTVLVPLFHEANMVPQLMSALAKLDYPSNKLEIFMICEAVDPKTIAAVRKRLGGIFHLVIVPPGTPQTKPRALNVAMQRARGDFVTIQLYFTSGFLSSPLQTFLSRLAEQAIICAEWRSTKSKDGTLIMLLRMPI